MESTDRITTCGIIGSGTAARALAPALVEVGVRVVAIAGRNSHTAQQLATAVDARVLDVASIPGLADCTIIAVPDGAIPEVANGLAHGDVRARGVVHLAGRLGLESLAAVARRGAFVGKMHPINSLAGGSHRLRNIAWGVEADPELLPRITDLIGRMGGHAIPLDGVDLDLYHAAAVVASNFLVALLDAADELWVWSGSTADALAALLPLVRGTLDNVEELGLPAALTGPIVRGDEVAISAQLETVHRSAPDVEPIYRVLALRALAMAARSGRSNAATEARLRELVTRNRMLQWRELERDS